MTSTPRLHTVLWTGLVGSGLLGTVALFAGCDSDVSASTSGSPTGTGSGTAAGTGSGTASGTASGSADGGGGMGGAGVGGGGTGGGGVGGAGGGMTFMCGDMGLMCDPGDICIRTEMTAGPMTNITYACEPDPCSPNPLDCTCADQLCPGGPGATCSVDMGVLVCQSGGVCAHPDTPILTPNGERAISTLRAGDLVLTMHEGRLEPRALLAATKTRVRDHAVVEVTLQSGRRLLVSAGHPTDDGRLFGDLVVGGWLGDERVQGLATRPYDESHTYDILPDSDSGTYVAAGALIGSTLR